MELDFQRRHLDRHRGNAGIFHFALKNVRFYYIIMKFQAILGKNNIWRIHEFQEIFLINS